MMEYKGYTGRITALDDKQGIIHGEVIGINDIVTFQGKTSEELLQAFHDSVDDYLAFCEERSETPEKPFSGKFLVRISPSLHQQASLAAKNAGESLNAWVVAAIKGFLGKSLPSGAQATREREHGDIRASLLALLERLTPFPEAPSAPGASIVDRILALLERSDPRRPILFGRADPFSTPYAFPLEPDPLRSVLAQLLLEGHHEPTTRRHTASGRRLHRTEPEEEVE